MGAFVQSAASHRGPTTAHMEGNTKEICTPPYSQPAQVAQCIERPQRTRTSLGRLRAAARSIVAPIQRKKESQSSAASSSYFGILANSNWSNSAEASKPFGATRVGRRRRGAPQNIEGQMKLAG
eukprot:GHVT01054487.1.p2 GENE.GHVT01054487.1~~GHVT01054487.1.p2  ORF type:complete len:124 (-),score=16.90 GHVT01054487.1:137-508(-)